MAKLLSTIYQSYRPWLQINNGILIAYRKRKERERDGVCSIRFSVCCTCRLPQASGGWGNLLKLVRDCPCLLNVSCVSCPVLSCPVLSCLLLRLVCPAHMCSSYVHSPRPRRRCSRSNNIYIFMCQITLNFAFIGCSDFGFGFVFLTCAFRLHGAYA